MFRCWFPLPLLASSAHSSSRHSPRSRRVRRVRTRLPPREPEVRAMAIPDASNATTEPQRGSNLHSGNPSCAGFEAWVPICNQVPPLSATTENNSKRSCSTMKYHRPIHVSLFMTKTTTGTDPPPNRRGFRRTARPSAKTAPRATVGIPRSTGRLGSWVVQGQGQGQERGPAWGWESTRTDGM